MEGPLVSRLNLVLNDAHYNRKSIYSLYYGKGIIVSGSKDQVSCLLKKKNWCGLRCTDNILMQTVRLWSPTGKHHRTLSTFTFFVFELIFLFWM